MVSLPRRRDREAAASAAQQRLALLAAEIADAPATGSTVGPDLSARPRRDAPDDLAGRGPGAATASAVSGRDPADASPGVARPPASPGRHRADALPTRQRVGAAVADRLPLVAHRLRAMDSTVGGADGAATSTHGTRDAGISGHHVSVVALVVAALVAAGAWWVLAGRPGDAHVVAPLSTGTTEPSTGAALSATTGQTEGPGAVVPSASASGSTLDPTAAATAGELVVVDVTGKVRAPGLVTLPAGSRVADALAAADGARPGVDLTSLNLARPLVDGEQILVGVDAAVWPAPTAPGAAAPTPTAGSAVPGAPIDVNTASLEQLDTLPGIGPVTGQAILDWRAANGGFTSVDELLEVDGIGDATLADIRDLVTV